MGRGVYVDGSDEFVEVETNALIEEVIPPPTPIATVTKWIETPEAFSEFSRRIAQIQQVSYSDGSRQTQFLSPGYTELSAGLNYKDSEGQWRHSVIEPQIGADGSVSFDKMPTKYRFAPDANLETVVESSRDGMTLARSAIAGLSYYDLAGGRSVVIASVRNSSAQAFNEGVYYTNAFEDVDADIVYRIHSWGESRDQVPRLEPGALYVGLRYEQRGPGDYKLRGQSRDEPLHSGLGDPRRHE